MTSAIPHLLYKRTAVNRLFLIVLMVSLGINIQCRGQAIRFTVMTSHDGLLSNTINAILKDHYGFLWFATADGLDRFDGMEHKPYRFDPADKSGYRSKEVTSIYEDQAGQLWVATLGGGLYYLDRSLDRFKTYPESPSYRNLANSYIKSIYGDAHGRIWIGMIGGLCVLDPKTKQEIYYQTDNNKQGQLHSGIILSIFRDSQNRMWIGTDKGLYLYDEKSNNFIAFRHENNNLSSIPNEGINTIAECQHRLWIGTNNGLSCLSPDLKTFKNFKYNPNDDSTISGNLIYSIAANGDKIWVGTEGGLNILDPVSGKVKRYNHDDRDKFSISSKSIRCIYNDPDGIYWLGTYQGGVDKYDKNLTLFNSKQNNAFDPAGLSAPFVSSFAETRDGDLFVGTDGGGLNLLHSKSGLFSHIAIKSKAKNNSAGLPILSMMLDGNQQLWIGTFQDGLFIYDTKTGGYKQLNAGKGDEQINHNEIFCLKESSKGKIWIGTNGGGVNVYDPGKKTFFKYVSTAASAGESLLPVNGFIRAIEEDHEGNIWIGTYGSGIAVLNPATQKFKVYNNKSTGMAIDRTFSLLQDDHSGNMWIGTAGDGLYCFNSGQKKIINYAAPDELTDGVVHKILEDYSGNIWLSTDKGICTLNKTSKKFTHYNACNGLQNDAFIDGSGIRTKKGVLFFGGAKGFNYIDPQQEVKHNDNAPPVFLTTLKVNNNTVLSGNHSPLKQDISVAKQIDLDYKENFSISYSAINFTLPQQNRYAYILKSFNKSWNYVGSATTAYYTNLDPGEYVFMVKACNNDGIWNNAGTQIRIVIHPPIWMTWYAYLLYVLIASGALLLIRHRGIKKLKGKLALEQERKEAERLHELDMLKIKFLTNLSHEFRTPISLIMAPADKLLSETKDEQTTGQLAVIRRNARRLLNLVNQLLDFRKLEEQELKLCLAEGEIISFISDVADSFHDLSESRGITFNFNAPKEKMFVRYDHDKVERILFNLLSNAFKFTLPGGKVSVYITLRPTSETDKTVLEIKISDTGIGIEPDRKDLIFKRFYQAEDMNTGNINPGSGIGLSITKEFVEMHGGSITVESELGKGADFCVLIPLEVFATSSIEVKPPIKTDVEDKDLRIKKNNVHAITDMPVLLIVEDNDEFRYYIKDNLITQYKIVEASNGIEGWDKALSCHPDLIISDITMPFMNGITLSRKIKADKRTSHIPFIMLTACTREDEQLRGLESGANDYLTKPFNFEILNIKIKNLLQLNAMLKNTYKKQLKVIHPDIDVTSSGEIFLNKVVNYIDNNLNNPKFSVVDLSEHLSMSRGALYTKIFELTGLPPVEFIRSYKLDRAAILLLKSDLTVTQIAYEAGFATPHYFSRSFREKFNMLPSDYRKVENNSVLV
ncbi:hybrid sensor histidine kinase/response regulator transcription factor [Mucilaginibacter flavus]|uniref:hybrid sensor histidine kinase/response regulator transcription factor n=1 Tax=Mucilaginibacter flavus TaxID=931504 RepID=UPI0025B55131|nr:hybrid sensor histidine kinase/response regulator transcription factor [Mucilaginibacter flavus]MDN3580335.1 two-component regulator propeller domain-containing protein [Mucilaginibacter flavus]